MMVLFRILDISGVERGSMVRSIVLKILESAVSALPIGVACVVVTALMRGDGMVEGLPYPVDTAPAILSVVGILVGLYVLQWVLCHYGSVRGYCAGYRMTADIRIRLAEKLPTLPASWFRERDSGELAHILMQDMATVEHVPGLIIPRLVAALTLPVLALAVLAALDIRLGLALFFGIALSLPVLVLGHRALRQATQAYSQAQAVLNARLIEFIRGIAVIKSLGLAGDEGSRCHQAISSFCDRSRALTWSFVRPTILFPLVLVLGCILVLAGGAHFVIAGTLDPVVWPVFFLVSLRLLGPLSDLMEFSALIRHMEAAMERISMVLEAHPDTVSGPDRPVAVTEIAFRDVGFSYVGAIRDHACDGPGQVSNLNFVIPANTVTAVVGATGAGKSTLARLLARQHPPQEGRITIGGIDLASIPDEQLHRLVGVVSQTVMLFTETVADNIRLGRADASDEDVVRAARAARCHDFITRLPDGYSTILSGAGAALSGGERQRIALARAFLKDSPVLVLDEVTSALDVENERLVQDALGELVRNRTVLVIAHRLWTVRHANQILVMDRGQIVEYGPHATLMNNGGLYSDLWSSLLSAPGWHGASLNAA